MKKQSHILAIDACTEQGVVALFIGGELRGQLVYREPKAHARLLAPMVRTLLQDMNINMQDVDAVAVVSGPGSYTGLRVSVSTAKGICLATGAKLLSITSLEMLALSAAPMAAQLDARICPLIDARRMEAYSQVFDHDMQKEGEPAAVLLEEAPFDSMLQEHTVVFVGDGVEKAKALLGVFPNAIFIAEWPDGLAHIGATLERKLAEESTENLALFEPFYLKSVRITKAKKKSQL